MLRNKIPDYLIDLSTVGGSKINYPPWVNIRCEGWVKIQCDSTLLTVEVTFVVVAAVIVLTAPVAPASAVVRLVRPVQPLTSAEKVAPVELMVAVGIPVTVMPAANAVPETFAFNTVLALEFPVSLSNAVSESIVPALNV